MTLPPFLIPSADLVLVEVGTFYEISFASNNSGLLYLATCLKKSGFSVRVVTAWDLFTLSAVEIENLFKGFNPKLFGFYAISDNIFQVARMAGQIKKWLPESKIVLGGPLATVQAEELVKNDYCDFVLKGEAEVSLVNLLDCLKNNGGELKNIPGLVYDGFSHPEIPHIEDLDKLPFPDYDLVGVNGFFNVVSGRGCPYKCAFCFQGVHGDRYRYRNAESVVEEIIQNLEKYQVRTFGFIDDTFVANPGRTKEIAERLIAYQKKSGREFAFYCEGRVDILTRHPELIELLAGAGLARLQLGIESGNQKVLDCYNKKITLEQIKEVVKRCAQTGKISVYGNFIIGGPFENEETFAQSLSLAEELLESAPGLFECSAALLAPYPGTPIYENPEKFGLEILDKEFKTGITLRDLFMHPRGLTPERTRGQYQEFLTKIERKMFSLLPKIPSEIVERQFNWSDFYGMKTNWHETVLAKKPVITEYFKLLSSPRFLKPGEIKPDYLPFRVSEVREYSPDGKKIILDGGKTDRKLTDKMEIAAYELAAGKFTFGEIFLHIKEKLPNITEQKLRQIYKNLAEDFYLLFYQ